MKRINIFIGFIFFCISINIINAQEDKFALGVILGEPTGISAKLWTSTISAFDFGFGRSIGGDRINNNDIHFDGSSRYHIHFDYILHDFNAVGSTGNYPIYYGVGARFNSGGGYNNSLAVRFVVGLAWMPRDTPIDMFIEFVPSLQLTSKPGFAIDSALGLRYYL